MAKRISEALKVDPAALEALGVFDGFVDIDARFHIDPHLLDASSSPEMKGAHDTLLAHFDGVLTLSKAAEGRPAIARALVHMLKFPESGALSLGYGTTGNSGRGIGRKLAAQLADTARQIAAAGIEDPVVFELVGLFEDGIGADRVSDMVAQVIRGHLLRFSARVAQDLDVPTVVIEHGGSEFAVPEFDGRAAILLPRDILRDLPVADDWSDIDTVASHNAELRGRVNQRIGSNWRHATRRVSKGELRKTLFRHPDLIRDLVTQYRAKPRRKYDFRRDPAGELIWHDIATRFAGGHPIEVSLSEKPTAEEVHALVRQICQQFARLLEDNALAALLYDDDGNIRNERFAQLLFYGVADSYCAANDINLSREPNGGTGPVDFKLASGYDIGVNVEVKYSSNSALVRGFEQQLPAYDKAERTSSSIYLIIQVNERETTIDRIKAARQKAKDEGKRVPEVLVADGRRKPSASKRK